MVQVPSHERTIRGFEEKARRGQTKLKAGSQIQRDRVHPKFWGVVSDPPTKCICFRACWRLRVTDFLTFADLVRS